MKNAKILILFLYLITPLFAIGSSKDNENPIKKRCKLNSEAEQKQAQRSILRLPTGNTSFFQIVMEDSRIMAETNFTDIPPRVYREACCPLCEDYALLGGKKRELLCGHKFCRQCYERESSCFNVKSKGAYSCPICEEKGEPKRLVISDIDFQRGPAKFVFMQSNYMNCLKEKEAKLKNRTNQLKKFLSERSQKLRATPNQKRLKASMAIGSYILGRMNSNRVIPSSDSIMFVNTWLLHFDFIQSEDTFCKNNNKNVLQNFIPALYLYSKQADLKKILRELEKEMLSKTRPEKAENIDALLNKLYSFVYKKPLSETYTLSIMGLH